MGEHIPKPIKTGPATWLGFILMCLGMFMAILDIQVVATSLPNIQEALSISQDAMSWIQTSYLLAEIIAIPLSGWTTRVLTLRWLFVTAICVFTFASVGCAFSGNFAVLVVFRVLQGFAGGMLIPAVFSAVFLLFPIRLHPVATTIAGVMAVLAPTVGPVVGGWISETWSWQWLFLINVAPGIIAAVVSPFLLPRAETRFAEFATLDILSLALMIVALASLEIGLKEAPHNGWLSPLCSILFLASAGAATAFTVRSLKVLYPVVEVSTLRKRSFAIGCGLSFCLGVGLFGSVYLMPVFLAYVRRHDAFEIGSIMLVTGVATCGGAARRQARKQARSALVVGCRLCPVRSGAGVECFSEPRRGLRRDVLAPGVARRRYHVLPAAAGAAGIGRSDGGRSAQCQRPLQPHAKPWRGNRDRLDRQPSIRTQRWARRSAASPVDRG